MLSRTALVTIVHNESQEAIVNQWGCQYCVLPDPVGGYPSGKPFAFDGRFNAAVISSFEWDEPLDVVFEAATQLPDVTFYVTGKYARGDPSLLATKPENCRLTGYIPYEEYLGLIRGADVVVDLVKADGTLLCGAFEAVSVGTPLIVSDWPVLRNHFSRGTVHVSNTAKGVCEGIRRVQREHSALKGDILLLREQLQSEWVHKFAELQHLLSEN
jgi:glycosyltransferase involved in cell wall biosynthesis